jgi:hypothetical protein
MFRFIALFLSFASACASAPPPASQSSRDPSNPRAEETPVMLAADTAGAPHGAAAARPVVYACPMHPEVTANEPGHHCPKCGMELVPRRDAQ